MIWDAIWLYEICHKIENKFISPVIKLFGWSELTLLLAYLVSHFDNPLPNWTFKSLQQPTVTYAWPKDECNFSSKWSAQFKSPATYWSLQKSPFISGYFADHWLSLPRPLWNFEISFQSLVLLPIQIPSLTF